MTPHKSITKLYGVYYAWCCHGENFDKSISDGCMCDDWWDIGHNWTIGKTTYQNYKKDGGNDAQPTWKDNRWEVFKTKVEAVKRLKQLHKAWFSKVKRELKEKFIELADDEGINPSELLRMLK